MATQNGNSPQNSAELELLKAKIAFIKAASDASPLNIVDRHPVASIGVAFLLGYASRFLGRSVNQVPNLLASLTALSGIAARIVPLIRRQ